jgi:hypothetical protein
MHQPKTLPTHVFSRSTAKRMSRVASGAGEDGGVI